MLTAGSSDGKTLLSDSSWKRSCLLCPCSALGAGEDQDGCPVLPAKHEVLLHVGMEHSWKCVTVLTVQLQHQTSIMSQPGTLPSHTHAATSHKVSGRCLTCSHPLPLSKLKNTKGKKILFIVGLLAKCRVGVFDMLPSAFLCQSVFSTCFHGVSEKDKIPFLAKWLWSHFKLGEGCRRRCSPQLLHLKMTGLQAGSVALRLQNLHCSSSQPFYSQLSEILTFKSWHHSIIFSAGTDFFFFFRDALVKSTQCSWDVLSQV